MNRNQFQYRLFVVIFFVTVAHFQPIYAQGCSDAGLCTVPTLNPEIRREQNEPTPNSIHYTLSYGRADHGIEVRSGSLQYGRAFDNGVGIDIKTTFVSLTDGAIQSSGLSDLFATVNYRLTQRIAGTAGIKIPLGDGNAESNGNPLPMDFQPSLGTVDVIAGVSFMHDYGHIAVAIQQPLTHNTNRFSADQHPPSSPFRKYQSTNEYHRGGDLLIRLSYPIAVSEQWSVTPGILPIYHLADDSFVDSSGVRHTIAGSSGLTFNINLFAAYMLGSDQSIEASTGFPILTRTARPDGLTRSVVVTVDFKHRW